ncbi:unnamed protein product [Brugia timori]|uniref:Uncharacterized protein n=1 Tax=Brugia timori TaxID=42155 RepID=A0A0R3QH53_9BILA|nr:unnamed protein product [Brugia timori]
MKFTHAIFSKRLRDGGANVIECPRKISNVKLFLRQFLYRLWLLLLGKCISLHKDN